MNAEMRTAGRGFGGGGWRRFPSVSSAARLTGVRGWPAVPASLSEGVAQRVRQLAFADGS